LNEAGDTVLYRDTLEVENLDKNELEASFEALSDVVVRIWRRNFEICKIGFSINPYIKR